MAGHRLLCLGVAAVLTAALPRAAWALNDWVRLSDNPSVSNGRTRHAMAYVGGNQVLMFGGMAGGEYQDTWLYTVNGSWRQVFTSPLPPHRTDHAMAYIGSDRVLLFGGYDAYTATYGDTWVFTRTSATAGTWQEMSPATHPTARFGHRMVYLGGDRVLLFGGSPGGSNVYDQTWIYDLSDNNWTELSPAAKPGPSYFHGMAYIGDDKVLMFDYTTWVYDVSENTWTQQSPATAPLVGGPMAYIGLGRAVLFGGGETWVYDLSANTWVQDTNSVNPPAVMSHALAEGSLDGSNYVVLFGGQLDWLGTDLSKQTWRFGGGDYPRVCTPERCDGVDNDCDALIDEGFNLGDACTSGIGECARPGNLVCSADGLSSVCDATAGAPTAELCNGLDDDCDNVVDDGFPVGTSCSVGIGACARSGHLVCNVSGSGTVCDASPGVPATETCNGVDDDCDGTVDDGDPGGGASCSTGLPGICAAGVVTCSAASLVCAQTFFATTETCNGLDDDCDGSSDESATDAPTWYRDADGDGFGTSAVTLAECVQPAGYVANASDCDDANPLLKDCNTPVSGDPVTFDDPGGYASVTLPNVTSPGETTVSSGSCVVPPEGIFLTLLPICVDIDTTATFEGEAEVCIFYSDSGMTLVQEQNLHMVRCPAGQPCELLPTSSQDTVANQLCALTTGFSGFAVGTPTDGDSDFVADLLDNCPTVLNFFQEDGGTGLTGIEVPADGVGNACDNCVGHSNPRVPGWTPATGGAAFLAINPWATLTGGQRDDDHDGYGNRCDADFTATGVTVGPNDLTQYRSASGKARSSLTACGVPTGQRCARFDLNESGVTIGPDDLTVYRSLSGKTPGPRCPTCPLACQAGSSGSCAPLP